MEPIFRASKTSWGIWISIDAEEIEINKDEMRIAEIAKNSRIETSFRKKFFRIDSDNQEEVDLIIKAQ